MNDSQDELNVRLANRMKNNQQQKLEKIKSLSQNNFYTFIFSIVIVAIYVTYIEVGGCVFIFHSGRGFGRGVCVLTLN